MPPETKIVRAKNLLSLEASTFQMVVTAQAQHRMHKHPKIEPESDSGAMDSGTTFLIHSTGLPFTGQLVCSRLSIKSFTYVTTSIFRVIINCVLLASFCNEETTRCP